MIPESNDPNIKSPWTSEEVAFKNSNRTGIIFAIDACHESSIDLAAAFDACSACIQKIIFDNDLIGVVVFGSSGHMERVLKYWNDSMHNDYSDLNYPNSSVADVVGLISLCQPSAKVILALEHCAAHIKDNPMESLAYHKCFLNEVLWESTKSFARCSKLAHSQTCRRLVVLLTANDNPFVDDREGSRQVLQRAKDLHDAQIHIEVIPTTCEPVNFDYRKFHQHLMMYNDQQIALIKQRTSSNHCDCSQICVERVLKFKRRVQRPYCQIVFKILSPGNLDNCEVRLDAYILSRKTTAPSKIKLFRRTTTPVLSKAETRLKGDDDATTSDTNNFVVLPSEIAYGIRLAERKAVFDAEEIACLRSQINDQIDKGNRTSLTLIGFKPRSKLEASLYIKPGYFVAVPPIRSSSSLIEALRRRCIERGVFAVARMKIRANCASSLVALIPARSEPGFFIQPLPFADDVREIPTEEKLEIPTDEILDLAGLLVKKLSFEFNPKEIPNPHIDCIERCIRLLALDKPDYHGTARDKSKPDETKWNSVPVIDLLEKLKLLTVPTNVNLKRDGESSNCRVNKRKRK